MISRKRFNQAGDTIVEVLIAIGILSMILGASYAVAIKSSRSVRDAQERTEAQKIAMGSMERLRINIKSKTPDDYTTAGASFFCIKSDGSARYAMSAVPPLNVLLTSYDSTYNYDASCTQRTQNSDPVSYYVMFERTSGDPTVFTVFVRWESGAGKSAGDNNQVRFSYRIEL